MSQGSVAGPGLRHDLNPAPSGLLPQSLSSRDPPRPPTRGSTYPGLTPAHRAGLGRRASRSRRARRPRHQERGEAGTTLGRSGPAGAADWRPGHALRTARLAHSPSRALRAARRAQAAPLTW